MDPLDPGRRVVDGRQDLAVAERPVGAAEPGAGDAHDAAPDDEHVGRDGGQQGQLLEARHGEADSTAAMARCTGRDRRDAAGAALSSPARCRRAARRRDARRTLAWPSLTVLIAVSWLGLAACGDRSQLRARLDAVGAPASVAIIGRPGFPGWPTGPDPDADRWCPSSSARSVVVGSNRFLYALDRHPANKPIASPELLTTARFYDLAADPATPIAEAPGSVHLDRARRARPLSRDGRLPACWSVGRRDHRPPAAGQPDRTARAIFDVRAASTTPTIGAAAPAVRHADGDRRGGHRRHLDRSSAGPGLLPDLGQGRPRRRQAVRARLRHAALLHQPDLRPDAGDGQGGRRAVRRARSTSSTSSPTSSQLIDGQPQPDARCQRRLPGRALGPRVGHPDRALHLRRRRRRQGRRQVRGRARCRRAADRASMWSSDRLRDCASERR